MLLLSGNSRLNASIPTCFTTGADGAVRHQEGDVRGDLAVEALEERGDRGPGPLDVRVAIEGGQVAPEKLKFPKLPGVQTTTSTLRAYRVDYGPRFASEGVITIEPPKIAKPFPMQILGPPPKGK